MKTAALKGESGRRSDAAQHRSDDPRVPNVSAPIVRWFTQYSRRYIRRHFHSVRVLASNLPSPALAKDGNGSDRPIVVFSNHASWWDPLVCLVAIQHYFPDRTIFAPMDEAMLSKYAFFRRLGFFGVAPRSARGALQFVRTAEAILASPSTLLVITPQGRFADARERPVRFESGIAHLAARLPNVLFIPCAAEYVFWDERLPEILLNFGKPVEVSHVQFAADNRRAVSPDQWKTLLEEKLCLAQDELATESAERNPAKWKVLLRGGAGQGGVYDWWRGLRARIAGEQFRREHGNK